jgi:hypothetical protein
MCCACGGGTSYAGDSGDETSYDGIWYHIDGSIGTWTLTSDGSSGEWSRDDDSDGGTWSYEDGYTTFGYWINADTSESGQWVSTTEDPYTRYMAVNPVGVFYSIDESSGYWTTYVNETDGGLWIRADGSEHGSWAHYDGSTTTGTWETTDGDSSGQWVSTTDNELTKYIALNEIGTFQVSDGSSGYWTTYADDTYGGLWIKTDGSDQGSWNYNDGATDSGSWWNESD